MDNSLTLILIIAFYAVLLYGCARLGMWAAAPYRKTRYIVLGVITAWILGTLVMGVPAFAAGWIWRRHHPKAAAA